MAAGAAVAHSGRLWGPAVLLQASCKSWKLVDRWKEDRPACPFFACSDHLLRFAGRLDSKLARQQAYLTLWLVQYAREARS
eukprot:2688035-Alexandrium_andersonii.AAC.1